MGDDGVSGVVHVTAETGGPRYWVAGIIFGAEPVSNTSFKLKQRRDARQK
jgi:hypothetical protein